MSTNMSPAGEAIAPCILVIPARSELLKPICRQCERPLRPGSDTSKTAAPYVGWDVVFHEMGHALGHACKCVHMYAILHSYGISNKPQLVPRKGLFSDCLYRYGLCSVPVMVPRMGRSSAFLSAPVALLALCSVCAAVVLVLLSAVVCGSVGPR